MNKRYWILWGQVFGIVCTLPVVAVINLYSVFELEIDVLSFLLFLSGLLLHVILGALAGFLYQKFEVKNLTIIKYMVLSAAILENAVLVWIASRILIITYFQ